MSKIGAAGLTVGAVFLATAAFAQAPQKAQTAPESPAVKQVAAQVAALNQSTTTTAPSASGPAGSRTLFTIGGVNAHLWTPAQPYYDGDANRNFNADPLWEAQSSGTPPSPTGSGG